MFIIFAILQNVGVMVKYTHFVLLPLGCPPLIPFKFSFIVSVTTGSLGAHRLTFTPTVVKNYVINM